MWSLRMKVWYSLLNVSLESRPMAEKGHHFWVIYPFRYVQHGVLLLRAAPNRVELMTSVRIPYTATAIIPFSLLILSIQGTILTLFNNGVHLMQEVWYSKVLNQGSYNYRCYYSVFDVM